MRRWVVSAIGGMVLGLTAVPAGASESTGDPDALELARRHAPIVLIQRQTEECGPGEPYLPTDALALVGHPDVELRDGRRRIVTTGPTGADLARAPHDWHIDFPGAALRPGCDFERWFREHGDDHATLYARVVTDPDHPGRLALQYWSFWIYNDWNNLHEGDWEMVQILFDAATPSEALGTTPIEMVVAQHEGAERRPWEGVEREGDRPVVYPAGGSHATFFETGLWLGKRPDAGFGCDDTRAPSERLDPELILVPEVIDPDGEHGWLAWRGRWGEKQPIFKNGPEGPIAKTQWSHPVSWTEDTARTRSLRVPVVSGDVTDLFCSATARGSVVLARFIADPVQVVGLLLVVLAVVVGVARRTRWSPAVAHPVVRRRRSGQVLRSAWRLVWTERRAFLPVAAIVVVGGLTASLVRVVIGRVPLIDDVALLLEGDSVAGALLSLTIGSLVSLPVAVGALTVGLIVADRIGRPGGGDGRRPVRPLALITTIAVLAVATGPLWWPLGVVLLARWGVAPVLSARGSGVRGSLRASAALTRGRRVPTAAVLSFAVATVGLAGPLLGGLVLIVTAAPFAFVNLFAALVSAVLIPWLAAVTVLVWGDLESRGGPTDPVV
jgi:hypothetical protein